MMITRKNKQLIRTAASILLLLLVLAMILIAFFWGDHPENKKAIKKIVSFTVANTLCSVINILLLVFLTPFVSQRKNSKIFSFYVPSFLIVFAIALIVAETPLINLVADEHPLKSPVFAPLFFVASINTLSLLSIDLILLKFEQSNIKYENAHMKAENAELKMKSLQAQHEKLKNQLHPHFLFNSLNALKSLIRRDPELAENYLIKLSGFLRFSISHNEQNVVSLEEELKFSLYYLEMQKIRFRNALTYEVDIPLEQQAHTKLPVFSLQLVLENAIKHNKLTQELPLRITMKYYGPDCLLVENNVHEKLNIEPASGIGLKNLSDRYRLLTQEDIKVHHTDDCFQVFLKLIGE